MQVAFHLRRRPTAAPASALLLLSRQTADLARLCTHLGYDPLPPVYVVADGFLVKLPQPRSEAFGGVLRLRSLADNLLVPVDADLLPALLPDEVAGLARRRGLIFLPAGRVLEFDPTQPLLLSAVVNIDKLRREAWRPLPEPDPLAERLVEITLDLPEALADELPPPTAAEDGAEEPRPKDAGLPARIVGKAAFGAGKALSWLGKTLGMKGLAATGMNWMEAGLGWAPHLAESVLGRQEATLRELLRAFREGDVERALRRALPLRDMERGATPATGANLPFHDLRYSLRNILGGSGGGGSIWFTEADLQEELAREYRRQAALAVQRGDYRRAAFIHGKLLNDYRAAAAVLSKGGLHRDAAALYLKRLDDPLAAAREYEAAGEVDRALELYRRRGEHLLAGDLLRRAGDEEQALEEYWLAAEQVVASGRGHYQAGELLRTRAGRTDLAQSYYLAGWAQRPWGSPVPCAIRLAQAYAQEGMDRNLIALANTAAEYFAAPGNDGPATEFYNEVARLADQLPKEEARDHLRDCALTGIAGKLRQQVAAKTIRGGQVPALQRASQIWAPAVVSDAQFALRQAGRESRPSAPAPIGCTRVTVPARIARVTAVCQAADSAEVFIGFESGEVVCFRSLSREVSVVTDEHRPILSLAATQNGDALVVLGSRAPEWSSLKSLVKRGTFEVTADAFVDATAQELCLGLAGDGNRYVVGVRTIQEVQFLQGPQLVVVDRCEGLIEEFDPGALVLYPSTRPISGGVALLALCDREFVFWDAPSAQVPPATRSAGGWRPGRPRGGWLSRPVLTCLNKGAGGIELAGIDSEGHLYFSEVRFDGGSLSVVTKALSSELPFLAAAVLRPGVLAAVTKDAVHWLRRGENGLLPLRRTSVSLPSPIACFRHHRSKELIVVCAGGTVGVLPMYAE